MLDRQALELRASHVMTAGLVLVGTVFFVIALAMQDTFYLRLATEALIFAGLALSVDLLLGCTGLLSLGQALYFGAGAYVSALLLISGRSFWEALAGSALLVLLLSIVGGLIANRVRGVYFALITIALAQVGAKVVYNTRALGASDGLIGIPVVEISGFGFTTGSAPGFFVFTAAIILGLYALLSGLLNTPLGRILLALRANERRIPFLGFSVWRARMIAYVLAATLAGTSGALYPMLRGFVSPELLYFTTSGNALIAVIVGGVGTLTGALYGSLFVIVLKSLLSSYTTHSLMVIGALFIVLVLFLPQGFAGWLRPRLVAWMDRRQSQTGGTK
ncbi:branched-chain amino acid ABC transporter permease [Variovorax ginsengisoli]|uniref:Branched-chain amino acid ABC transporter permease n=1 Tax=Variovorax ginsengisoli TaxID=363844 RepID=A0ABT8SC85_9BURK|nr:branched-chain amino acid ABC transporter permease [Variovorax ginsengisoli]MDN8617363.1 branched-chain amino acid ABC transporter permease [Variovorax ginsengisoli]MDO1536533.1 branched-chain amino acid ABC transporter permease [Variovorax ginsengisoli]